MGRITADHPKPHELSGQRVMFLAKAGPRDGSLRDGDPVTVIDWYDRETGKTWLEVFGDDRRSPATRYADRRRKKPSGTPKDNNVVLVYTSSGEKVAVHQSEIERVTNG